ncbi:protein-glutamine gamma-glutamyltransferase E-like isoform X1 [Clavelina lepadiformis]|uniref:protein-glutamine gamma-glutamyltransferase E-like isoform X1 n=1 Tax=Clavelina lepadiformis TaxID=159417 RepID=UPI0040412A08
MGNTAAKQEESSEKEDVVEYLDEHPIFLSDYIDRNPHLLDNYVVNNVDEATVSNWLEKVQKPPPTEVLQTLRIDYLKEKNCTQHHTDKYMHKDLVIRRADYFALDLCFKNRTYRPAKDKILLEFAVGNSKGAQGTLFRIPVKDSLQGSQWSCMIVNENETAKKITVQVNVPPDAIIGRYKLTVEVTSILADGPKTERKAKPDVIVICNPFKPADVCFMEKETERNEYVLSDTGIIYFGQYYRIGGKKWLFGQFEEGILDIALKLLREDSRVKKNPVKSLKQRSSPAYCSRILSAMVNCVDDKGVLYGRWDGEYSDGVRPTTWNGSVKILKQWNETKMQPVKYGQCWVFSGILTTVLRALGIPARSVTNFQSAHDVEFNMTIDKFVDENGDEADFETGDSIWNFHVWNEGYFRRPDLPKGYDGWQAVDATPQEESSGIYQCGPAPVKAIKNGEIFIGSDTNFLFGEVNADRLTWKINQDQEVEALIKREMRHVGRAISTKAVGTNEREDLTEHYKYPEDSVEERAAFDRAYAHAKKTWYHEKLDTIEKEEDIKINIKSVGDVVNGKTVTVVIEVKNDTTVDKTAAMSIVLKTMLHNDQQKAFLKRIKYEKQIKAGKAETQSIELPFSEYGRHLVDNAVIRVVTTARVKETDNFYVNSFDVQVESPDCIAIECDDQLKRSSYNNVKVTIKNPLPVTLTKAVFSLDGSGFSGKEIKIKDPIPPKESYTYTAEVYVYRSGTVTLMVDFDAVEIMNIKAEKDVTVVE